jgi:hypothetical protein
VGRLEPSNAPTQLCPFLRCPISPASGLRGCEPAAAITLFSNRFFVPARQSTNFSEAVSSPAGIRPTATEQWRCGPNWPAKMAPSPAATNTLHEILYFAWLNLGGGATIELAPNGRVPADGVSDVPGVLGAGPRYPARLSSVRLHHNPAHSA